MKRNRPKADLEERRRLRAEVKRERRRQRQVQPDDVDQVQAVEGDRGGAVRGSTGTVDRDW